MYICTIGKIGTYLIMPSPFFYVDINLRNYGWIIGLATLNPKEFNSKYKCKSLRLVLKFVKITILVWFILNGVGASDF